MIITILTLPQNTATALCHGGTIISANFEHHGYKTSVCSWWNWLRDGVFRLDFSNKGEKCRIFA